MEIFGTKFLLILAIATFILSLCLPGLTMEPLVTNNPKYNICDVVLNGGSLGYCFNTTGNISQPAETCDEGTSPLPPPPGLHQIELNAVSKQYCGTDWDTPVAQPGPLGLVILTFGFFGGYGDASGLGSIAWYANITALLAGILLIHKKYQFSASMFAVSILLGLCTFAYHIMPANEGGVGGSGVEHPGVGFYVWEFSFLLFLLYAIIRYSKSRIRLEPK